MACKIIYLPITMLLLLFSPFALVAENKSDDAPSTYDEEIWILLVDEPSGYLQDARESFILGDIKDAAHRIRKAEAFIKLESDRAKKAAKRGLKASAEELKNLSKAVEKHSIASGTILEEAFSRAEYALADHYYQLAQDYEANEQYREAAFAIEAAVSHLLFASFWAEESLEEADIIEAKEARSSANEMATEKDFKRNKLSEAIKGIGRGIRKLGERIQSLKPRDEEPQLK